MAISSLLIIFTIATTALAAATTSPNFRLVANVIGKDFTPSIQNWVLTSYTTNDDYDYAGLTAPVNDAGKALYIMGSAADVQNGNAIVVFDEVTPGCHQVYGLEVPQEGPQGVDGVHIVAGKFMTTMGPALAPARGTFLTFEAYKNFGGWFACNMTLGDDQPDRGIFLFSLPARRERGPTECVRVELIPEC